MEALEANLAATTESLNAASEELDAQRAALEEAQTVLESKEQALADANAEIDTLNSQIGALNSQSEEDQAQLEILNAQLSEAQDNADAIAQELEEARDAYEKQVAELSAYMLTRDLSDGDATAASTAANTIQVASDGVTGACQIVNDALSGNGVVITVQDLNGDELYRSETLAPGETLSELTLNAPQSAGEHDVMIVTTIYDDHGNIQQRTRVPAVLNVAD